MKIVINKCYGGFALSPEGLLAFYKLKNKPCYIFESETLNPYVLGSDKNKNYGFEAYSVPNPLDYDEKSLNDFYISNTNIKRNDPDLVKVVETLGYEKAGFFYSELGIVEIPDDVDWQIEDYDGAEWVSEKHRTWS